MRHGSPASEGDLRPRFWHPAFLEARSSIFLDRRCNAHPCQTDPPRYAQPSHTALLGRYITASGIYGQRSRVRRVCPPSRRLVGGLTTRHQLLNTRIVPYTAWRLVPRQALPRSGTGILTWKRSKIHLPKKRLTNGRLLAGTKTSILTHFPVLASVVPLGIPAVAAIAAGNTL